LKGLAVSWPWPRKTDSRGGTNSPLRKALLSPQLSARDATLAEGLAELLEQFAESTAARAAELVNEHRAPAEPRYYTTAEAADYLWCCVGRIYNLSSQGRLKGRKDGGGPACRSGRPALPSLPAVPAEATPPPPYPPPRDCVGLLHEPLWNPSQRDAYRSEEVREPGSAGTCAPTFCGGVNPPSSTHPPPM
jgi:hypothetical protein